MKDLGIKVGATLVAGACVFGAFLCFCRLQPDKGAKLLKGTGFKLWKFK